MHSLNPLLIITHFQPIQNLTITLHQSTHSLKALFLHVTFKHLNLHQIKLKEDDHTPSNHSTLNASSHSTFHSLIHAENFEKEITHNLWEHTYCKAVYSTQTKTPTKGIHKHTSTTNNNQILQDLQLVSRVSFQRELSSQRMFTVLEAFETVLKALTWGSQC